MHVRREEYELTVNAPVLKECKHCKLMTICFSIATSQRITRLAHGWWFYGVRNPNKRGALLICPWCLTLDSLTNATNRNKLAQTVHTYERAGWAASQSLITQLSLPRYCKIRNETTHFAKFHSTKYFQRHPLQISFFSQKNHGKNPLCALSLLECVLIQQTIAPFFG